MKWRPTRSALARHSITPATKALWNEEGRQGRRDRSVCIPSMCIHSFDHFSSPGFAFSFSKVTVNGLPRHVDATCTEAKLVCLSITSSAPIDHDRPLFPYFPSSVRQHRCAHRAFEGERCANTSGSPVSGGKLDTTGPRPLRPIPTHPSTRASELHLAWKKIVEK